MTGAPMSDVTSLFREAFFRYNSVNPLQPKACVRFATRSMLLLAEYCKQHGLHAEAHSALTRAQAQVSFWSLAPAQKRKWISLFLLFLACFLCFLSLFFPKCPNFAGQHTVCPSVHHASMQKLHSAVMKAEAQVSLHQALHLLCSICCSMSQEPLGQIKPD